MKAKGQPTTLAERVMIAESVQAGQSSREIAAALGRPLATVRKWRQRYQRAGRTGLSSQMGRAPAGALATASAELKNALLALRERYPGWGAQTLQLGIAKESQVHELLHHFAGQEVDGNLLGVSGKVCLPTFHSAAPYRSHDGQVEVDALAEGDERWVVEIKWRGKLVGVKELQGLLSAAQSLAARPWTISRAGFTPEARTFAHEEGIMLSGQAEIEQLARMVRRS